MPHFLRVMLPLAFVFLFGFILEYRAEVGADRTRFLTQETSVIQYGVRQIQQELDTATRDLFFVAELVSREVDDDAAGGRTPRPGVGGAEEQVELELLRRREGRVAGEGAA